MDKSFVIKGNICQTKIATELDLHANAFTVCVDGFSKGVFEKLPQEYASLPLYDYSDKPLVFSEAFYLATKGGGAFFGNVGSFEEGYEFDAVILDDSVLPHPQEINLAERMERAVYLGLDSKKVTAKYVAGRKVI